MRASLALMMTTSCLLPGCVRGGFEPASVDASCTPVWRCSFELEAPVAISELNTVGWETDPVLSRDCLTIYFGSDRPGGLGDSDLWQSQRTSRGDSFGAPKNLMALNTPSDDQRVMLTADGLQAFFTTRRPAGADSNIWTATRATMTDDFGSLNPVSFLNTSYQEYDVFLSLDGLRLYYISMPSGTSQDIMMASRPTLSASFGGPSAVTELNTTADEGNPTLSEDELFVVFVSERPGSAGADLWYARRASRQAPFGAPQRLPDVNTSQEEREPFLACGDTELWFVRATGATGQWDIYRSRFVAR